MTVTKGRRPSYIFPKSNQTSGSESLHIATPSTTDVDSDTEAAPRRFPLKNGACTIFETIYVDRKNVGRRKQRMLFNHLRIVDEEVEDSDYFQLMEDYKTPFARVLGDADALRQWNEFIELPEEEQRQLTELVPNIQPIQSGKRDNLRPKLSSRIKRAIKIKKDLSLDMVQTIENGLVDYFLCSPEGIFVSTPPTSFERLLLHAIANYHHLKSISKVFVSFYMVLCGSVL
uniref:R3H-associated N-terminal domain-containing protein n=1 Tax=Photinus pyralis TaxID=7054 RepID=A0A1Y1L998_PHOPY